MKFRAIPVEVDAIQWLGTNIEQALEFSPGAGCVPATGELSVPTLVRTETALPGDWIIRDAHGAFYICKPGVFKATYEPAEATP